ncbi:unnamed protein product [Adineta steineri]|uniref:AIG1-type G domain-containing protein n=1 Tax=Adineta steineri TaxID=433720 RepID=A0A819VVF7_9BILA|nr:unnamed protein product [Adineta steineri]CAF4115067.1 unnamed protein product [Adineta steineri]
MTTSNNGIGAIILGNSGVGKSFLGNVILGRETFKHQYRPTAVTLKTEYQESPINGQAYAIYNIPGLIENDQERVELNKREIDIAFRQHPNAVVLYVFSTNHGRIKNEDVVAFNAINAAYPLSQKSLVVVINGLDPERSGDYDAETTTVLSSLLKMYLPHVCFVNHIRQPSEKEPLRQQLLKIITDAVPTTHHKEREINLNSAEISKLTKIIEEFQIQIEEDREKYQMQVENLKKEFEEKERRQKVEQQEKEQKKFQGEIEMQLKRLQNETEAQLKRLQSEIEKLKVAPHVAPVDMTNYRKKPCGNCLSCHYLGGSPTASAGYYHLVYGAGYGGTYGVHPSAVVVCNCSCHQ